MTVFRSGAQDLWIEGASYVYATARSTATYATAGTNYLRVGQQIASGYYRVCRGYLVFDTSAIPDADTVTAVALNCKVQTIVNAATLATLYIYKYDWKSPLGADTTLRENEFDLLGTGADDGQAGAKETAEATLTGKTANTWVTVTGLDTSWIKKTGVTKYALRAKRDADGSGTQPSASEYVDLYSGDAATETDRPSLEITHGAGTAVRISKIYASGIICPVPFQQLG